MAISKYRLICCSIFLFLMSGFIIPYHIFSQAPEMSDTALEALFIILEDSFLQEDAERLTKILPAHYKIELRLGLLPPDSGFFSPSQVFYIWKKHFQESNTLNFELKKENISFISPKDIILQARWSFQRKDSPKIRALNLYFSLYREGNHWVIRKIRTSQLTP